MELSRSLFWDTDYDKLDWEKNARFIVERVLQMGNVEDFRQIKRYYGKKKLQELIKNIRYLDRKPMYFASVYFDIPLNDMRCFIIKQSNTIHWDY